MRFGVRFDRNWTHILFMDQSSTSVLTNARQFELQPLSLVNPFQKAQLIRKRRKRFTEYWLTCMWELCYHEFQTSCGISTTSPFALTSKRLINFRKFCLGPTYPRAITVYSEPSSTTVVMNFTWLIATCTKICTSMNSRPVYTQSFNVHATPSYTTNVLFCRCGISRKLERHPFSGLLHSVGELLHTP